MRRKLIRIGILILFILISVSLIYKISKILAENKKLGFLHQNITLVSIDFLKNYNSVGRNETILTLFHPSCDFCQAEAEQYRKSHAELKDFEVLWVSYDEKDSIQKFAKTYGLDTLLNMHFAYMDIEAMLERYGNVKFPTFLAYDKQGQLLKKFVGLTKPEEILKVYQME